ncbi:hypothetical protein HS088_TW21G01136 [Tripterygium wilfordii]|uniref:B box-type domain-containing protein n=1 Tax=Tripterygium wilfordii TaxID=458696 RepID=A0A7J7C493_TRIWF|nr:hypothetical protein HS088_TW21G01136 [Tripterygium wilfordii]
MSKCKLCDSSAKMYCESYQARLCWDCDAKVHSANFLVAKNPNTLLWHLCHYYTPWVGTGPRRTPIVSLCNSCVNSCNGTQVIRDVEERHGDRYEIHIDIVVMRRMKTVILVPTNMKTTTTRRIR